MNRRRGGRKNRERGRGGKEDNEGIGRKRGRRGGGKVGTGKKEKGRKGDRGRVEGR